MIISLITLVISFFQDSPITGMTMIMVVSTLSAMTALNMLYTGSARSLAKYNIRPKFYLIKMGMIIGNLQMAIFRVIANFWFFDCLLRLPFETRAACKYTCCFLFLFVSFFFFVFLFCFCFVFLFCLFLFLFLFCFCFVFCFCFCFCFVLFF